MFVKDQYGGYTNSDHIQGVWAFNDSGNWKIQCSINGVAAPTTLAGSWASQAACQEAMREMFDGVDPATYGD